MVCSLICAGITGREKTALRIFNQFFHFDQVEKLSESRKTGTQEREQSCSRYGPRPRLVNNISIFSLHLIFSLVFLTLRIVFNMLSIWSPVFSKRRRE